MDWFFFRTVHVVESESLKGLSDLKPWYIMKLLWKFDFFTCPNRTVLLTKKPVYLVSLNIFERLLAFSQLNVIYDKLIFKNLYALKKHWRFLLYVCQFLVRTCPRSRLGLHRVPGALRPRLWWGQTLSKEANIVEANWDRGKSKLLGSPWKLNAKPWSRAEKEVCQYTTQGIITKECQKRSKNSVSV